MTHGKNITSGPASTPRYDNVTPEHGVACYVTETPLVSPLFVVEHNIAISDAHENFLRSTQAMMNNSHNTVTSPLSDASNTTKDGSDHRSTGRKSKSTGTAEAAPSKRPLRSTSRAAMAKGQVKPRAATRKGASTVPLERDARIARAGEVASARVPVRQHVHGRSQSMAMLAGRASCSTFARRGMDEQARNCEGASWVESFPTTPS